jgi:hypothetical protein
MNRLKDKLCPKGAPKCHVYQQQQSCLRARRWGCWASAPSATPEAGRVVAWWEEPALVGGVSCAGRGTMKTCRQGEMSCSSVASAVRLTRHCPDEPRDQFNRQVCSKIFSCPCLPLRFVLISFLFWSSWRIFDELFVGHTRSIHIQFRGFVAKSGGLFSGIWV